MISTIFKRRFCWSTTVPKLQQSDLDKLDKIRSLPTTTLSDALWVLKYPQSYIGGIKQLIAPKSELIHCGYATTLSFVPFRPDLSQIMPKKSQSPEYRAFRETTNNHILCVSAISKHESIGGDIKLSILNENNAGGLITDGSIRDLDTIKKYYKFPVWAHGATCKQGPATQLPYKFNEIISLSHDCSGKKTVSIVPNDIIVCDSNGVMVIPNKIIDKVIKIAHLRETIEEIVIDNVITNKNKTGSTVEDYYPFQTPLNPNINDKLIDLLQTKGVLTQIQSMENDIFSE